MENDNYEGPRLVAAALAGLDYRAVVVDGHAHTIHPPTIHRICGACHWLLDGPEVDSLNGLLKAMAGSRNLCNALSWFIAGDLSLAEELSHGTPEEVLRGLETAFELIDATNFIKPSALRRSAATLMARPST